MQKKSCLAVAALAVGLLSAASAAPLETAVLEAPDRVWVSEELPQRARSSKLIPAFHVLRFADGRVAESLLAQARIYSTKPCETLFSCDDSTNHAVLLSAEYSTDGASIHLADVVQQDFTTSRPEADAVLRQNAVLAGTEGLQGQIEDGVLVLDQRRFLALPVSALQAIVAIPELLELPIDTVGECVLRGHHARITAPTGSLSLVQNSLVAYGELSTLAIAAHDRHQKMEQQRATQPTPEIEAALKRSALARFASNLMVSQLFEEFAANGVPTDATPLSDAALRKLTHRANPAIDNIPAAEQDRLWAEAKAMMRATHDAAPALFLLAAARERASQDGNDDAVMQLLCP